MIPTQSNRAIQKFCQCYHHPVKKQPVAFTRRKLASVVRRAITSYYTEEEQEEIVQAAKREGVSKSSFVASAALREARGLSRKLKP